MINIKLGDRKKIILIGTLILLISLVYLFWGLNSFNYNFFLKRRIPRLLVMYILGTSIGLATVVFQTITLNRILTPGILGIDAMYLFFNIAIIYFFSSKYFLISNVYISFFISSLFTCGITIMIHRYLFKKDSLSLDKIILVGIVIGGLFNSISSLLQMMLDPNEFSIVQDLTFASINNANTVLIYISIPILIVILLYLIRISHILDVLALGRDQSLNLGLDYDKTIKKLLLIVAIIMSISTSLVGPMAFLGIIIISLAREMLHSIKHKDLIIFTSLLGIISLLATQLVIERLLNNKVPISVLINFVGGFYFIILLLKGGQDV